MVSTLVSALALMVAFGPHVQATLQAVPELPGDTPAEAVEAETVEPEITETIVEGTATEIGNVSADPIPATVEETLETIEDTEIAPAEIATPDLESEASEIATDPLAAEIIEAVPERPSLSASIVEKADWAPILEQASAALTSTKTARGQFIQTNADGAFTTGSFALSRPGRMRFDYDDPTPILIVSDGTTVAMQDRDLETVDRVPIGSTPLGFILSSRLDVNDDIEVLSIFQNVDGYQIRVRDATGELEGTLAMVFDKESYELLGWLAVDGNMQTTTVDLVDIETNVRLDPRLFRLDEDEDEEDER